MPINPEIALGVKQFEMPDPLAAYAKVAAIKDAQNRNALSQLEFAKAQREEATTNALNDAYRAGYTPDGLNYDEIKNSLARSGRGSAIPAIEEFQLKNQKATTEAAKAGEELFTSKLASARRALDFFSPDDPAAPQQYEEYLRSMYSDKILGPRLTAMGAPIEKSLAALDSAVRTGKFPEFLQQSVLGADKVLQNRMEQNKPDEFERRVIAAGYAKGSPEYTRLMQQKVNLEATRAPGTSVNVSTGKEYGSQFGEEVAKSDTALLAAARSAPALAENAVNTLKILKQGNLITGTGATLRLNLAKALNLAGGTDAERIANTEALVSGQAASVLSSIKTSELGGGKTFTDNDLKFLERAKGGTLEMSVPNLTRLAELQHKAAQRAIETWTNRRKSIPAGVISQTGLGNEEYKLPPMPMNDKGWALHTDANGNQAYVSPDGKQFEEVK